MTDLSSYTDESLLNLLRTKRRNESFGELFKRHLPLVTGLCLYYVKDENRAHDIVMDIFEGLLRKVEHYEINNFKPWLLTYTRNHCLKLLTRSMKREKELFNNSVDVESVEYVLDEDHMTKERLDSLDFALEELKEHQKTCVNLFYLQGKSYHEIQSITGFSSNEVKSYIQNGKKNLKKKMLLRQST